MVGDENSANKYHVLNPNERIDSQPPIRYWTLHSQCYNFRIVSHSSVGFRWVTFRYINIYLTYTNGVNIFDCILVIWVLDGELNFCVISCCSFRRIKTPIKGRLCKHYQVCTQYSLVYIDSMISLLQMLT